MNTRGRRDDMRDARRPLRLARQPLRIADCGLRIADCGLIVQFADSQIDFRIKKSIRNPRSLSDEVRHGAVAHVLNRFVTRSRLSYGQVVQ